MGNGQLPRIHVRKLKARFPRLSIYEGICGRIADERWAGDPKEITCALCLRLFSSQHFVTKQALLGVMRKIHAERKSDRDRALGSTEA